jgi:hypothetical protein
LIIDLNISPTEATAVIESNTDQLPIHLQSATIYQLYKNTPGIDDTEAQKYFRHLSLYQEYCHVENLPEKDPEQTHKMAQMKKQKYHEAPPDMTNPYEVASPTFTNGG